jgi:hypothetical protein
MIRDRDVWTAALLIVKRYGEDAILEASERADQLLDEGDMAGAATWHRMHPRRNRAVAGAEASRGRDGSVAPSEWLAVPAALACDDLPLLGTHCGYEAGA